MSTTRNRRSRHRARVALRSPSAVTITAYMAAARPPPPPTNANARRVPAAIMAAIYNNARVRRKPGRGFSPQTSFSGVTITIQGKSLGEYLKTHPSQGSYHD